MIGEELPSPLIDEVRNIIIPVGMTGQLYQYHFVTSFRNGIR